mmetsp:Transcript_39499/g.80568  ORF Transcript_39499/g.80568 Transcript_39499/m.80568 type:complete len:252 (-) Transcript_39499:38-793(-)
MQAAIHSDPAPPMCVFCSKCLLLPVESRVSGVKHVEPPHLHIPQHIIHVVHIPRHSYQRPHENKLPLVTPFHREAELPDLPPYGLERPPDVHDKFRPVRTRRPGTADLLHNRSVRLADHDDAVRFQVKLRDGVVPVLQFLELEELRRRADEGREGGGGIGARHRKRIGRRSLPSSLDAGEAELRVRGDDCEAMGGSTQERGRSREERKGRHADGERMRNWSHRHRPRNVDSNLLAFRASFQYLPIIEACYV